MLCVGSNATATVTITDVFNVSLTSGTQIIFSINNLFSPPTTEQLDEIRISTNIGGYQIDAGRGFIAGLTARTMPLAVTSPTNLTVNTPVGLTFTFTLNDSVSRTSYVIIRFPADGVVNYVSFSSTVLFFQSPLVFVPASRELRLNQTNSSGIRNAGTIASISVTTYTTPSSARVTAPFVLEIWSAGGLKMQGSATLNILPKAYASTLSTVNTTINVVTSYSIVFRIDDALSSSAYFVITVPP